MEMLWLLVQSFSASEIKEVRRFLKKEFHLRPSQEQYIFNQILLKKTAEEVQHELFGEKVQQLPGKQKYIPAFRKLCSKLKSRLENFLIQDFLEKQEVQKQLILLDIYAEKNLTEAFQRTHTATEQNLKKNENQSPYHHWHQYEITRAQHNFQQRYYPSKGAPLLKDLFTQLDIYIVFEKFQHLITWLQHQRKGNPLNLLPILFQDELLQITRPTEALGQIPSIQVLRNVAYFLMEKPQISLEDLAREVMRNASQLTFNQLHMIFACVMGGIIRDLKEDRTQKSKRKLYLWYIWGWRKKVLFWDGKIHPAHYKNFLTIGIHLKRFRMVKSLLEELTPFLPDTYKEELFQLMNASLSFEMGDKKAVKGLRILSFQDVGVEITVSFYLIKAAYDLNQKGTIANDVAALRMRINRTNRITESQRGVFAHRLKNMQTFLSSNTLEKKRKLKLQLLEHPYDYDNPWILEHLSGIDVP